MPVYFIPWLVLVCINTASTYDLPALKLCCSSDGVGNLSSVIWDFCSKFKCCMYLIRLYRYIIMLFLLGNAFTLISFALFIK